jgi:SAM-dependent methyltransferase
MQASGADCARVYNLLWTGFARDVAPRILDFYSRHEVTAEHRSLLDLCCGTGQLLLCFLEHGYRVTGLDLSEAMLRYAEDSARTFVQTGQAHFVQADAAAFTLHDTFGLIVSTFDALNHLPDVDALQGCFRSARAVCVKGGLFIFDLNTREGLKRWNHINVLENDEMLMVNRGIYGGDDKAYTRINGFIRDDDGRYSRFEEMVYNIAFDLVQVRDLLLKTGWRDAYFARSDALAVPLDEPEREGRVFVVASA